MASPESIRLKFCDHFPMQSVQDISESCFVCEKSDWGNRRSDHDGVYTANNYYAHKGCVIICECFDLTIKNIKIYSDLSDSTESARIKAIIDRLNYLPDINIDGLTGNLYRKIKKKQPRTFADFLQAVRTIFFERVQQGSSSVDLVESSERNNNEIVQSRSSSSSSSPDCDTVDSKDDDGDADMAPASNSSPSSMDDSVQGYSDDDNDVDDLDSNNAFPDVTGLYGVDAFMLM